MRSDPTATRAEPRAMAQSVSNSTWFENAIRVGLVAYGSMHILIGWLGMQLAFGDRQGAPNQQGALQILAQQPGGAVLLWTTGLGMFALSAWQLLEALWGHTKDEGGMRVLERIGSVGKVVLYGVLGYGAIETAASGSWTTNEHSLTRRLLELPVGQLVVITIGVAIVIVAAIYAHRGLTTSFDKRLRRGALTGRSGAVVKRLGQVGYIAKGVAFVVLGGLFCWAGVTYDASHAGGLDAALRTLLDASLGPSLLVVITAGFVAFGIYCFAWARYADTQN